METEESSSSTTKNNEKIGKVLQKFLEPTFKIKNDVYLNLFLTHLVGKSEDNQKIWKKDKQLQEEFCQWIVQASTLWDGGKVSPQAAILTFTLNLASELSADEQVFVKLNCQNVYEGLVGVAETNSMKDPAVTLGLVTLMCSFLEHKSGLQWVMATTHWIDVVDLGLKAHTMYIRKQAYQFVVKLLEKTVCFNRIFAVNLVNMLIKPLKEVLRSIPSKDDSQRTEIGSRELFESLKPSMDLILETVEPMLKKFNRKVMQLFLEQETPALLDKFLLLSRNEDFSFELLRIRFVFLFYKLVLNLEGKKVVAHDDAISLFECKNIFDLIKNEMDKCYVRCVIRICDYAHELFCYLEPSMPTVVKKGNVIEFQIQVMFLQIAPMFGLSSQILSPEKVQSLILNDVFRTGFLHRWLKLSNVQNIQICYKWVNDLRSKPNLVDDVIFCLQYILKMKRLLNKERTATIFPALVYSLTDALLCMKDEPDCQNDCDGSGYLYLSTILETIVDLVESFDLTWKDSIETIRVMDLAYDVLQYPHSDNRVVIKGLKLLNTAISKYMSPDMVLLIYHSEDSKVSQTGSLLYGKCHDSAWEIRDSALEVVHTLSLNANTTFPAYTNILTKAELPQLVVNMALKDGEYYVRATAFKCLQELIQINEIWDTFLNIGTFLHNMLDVFENETEGIVRKEAAALIYKIDKYQKFPEEVLPRLYDVMTHAAIGDLHWEVKYTALDFWFNLWEQHLMHQGMIDHMFPTHTFSKEHKKIVALNEVEVRKRIVKVLNELSQIGCLHVMKCAVEDDCDIEVSKKATSFTFSMLRMLKVYKITSETVDLSQTPSSGKLQKTLPNQQFMESISPPASSLASSENLESPQIEFSNSPFFDPLSPCPAPYSPSLELGLLTPASQASQSTTSTNQSSPPENQSPYGNCDNSQEVPDLNIDCPLNPRKTSTINILSNIRLTNGVDGFGYEDLNVDAAHLEHIIGGIDLAQKEQMLDDFLNSDDITLLQKIYNPSDQVTNNTTQMKTKMYLAPSQYLKFVYTELETHATEKTLWLNRLDEFDSLLDDILKEYNIAADVNSMDCY